MSADRIAYFSNNTAASTADLDFWTARYATDMSTVDPDDNRAHVEAVLDYADSLLAANNRGRLAGMLTVAIQHLDRATRSLAAERERSVRHLTAYRSARQRSADHLAALVEADEERDALRAALADREDEVAELVVRLAEYTEITS
jgi:hypothetical protein